VFGELWLEGGPVLRLIHLTLVGLLLTAGCGSSDPEVATGPYCSGVGCSEVGLMTKPSCESAGHSWGALTTQEGCEDAGHTWIEGVGAQPDAQTAAGSDAGQSECHCLPEEHCSAVGLCESDLCVQGESTCATVDEIKHCDATGASFTLEACGDNTRCEVGECMPLVCASGTTSCTEGLRVTCNSLGTGWAALPCAEAEVCQGGQCIFVQPNILLLVDTSYSMNRLVGLDDETPVSCIGQEGCPPWTFPECDHPETPGTRLGVVKKILQELVTKGAESGLRLALQRFPQSPASPPTCFDGHYGALETMTQDNGAHSTVGEDWFQIYLNDVVVVPFDAQGDSGVDTLLPWVDFQETSIETGADCESDSDCADGFCWFGDCEQHDNPELRGSNAETPLGRSLFYAGEYLRHAVFVEGAACAEDVDCGSPHHHCEEGACHDPLGRCRSTRIIVFTDGVESANYELDDFYHPRVQAKRLHHGLGCAALDECVGGARCEGGICRPPDGVIADGAKVCEVSELACEADADCPAFACGSGQQCPGQCSLAEVTHVDGADGDRLTDVTGRAVSVQIHVVDASGIEGANQSIAAYGGGQHLSVDLGAAASIVASVLPLLDAKVSLDGAVCDLEAD
jgi:hypothetical protein